MALTVAEVRTYSTDFAPANLLIDGEEFTDEFITLCMSLALDSFNNLPPASVSTMDTFPSKSILLLGTCWHMFEGKSMLVARNTMNYSDGGLQIPLEERFELYRNLAMSFRASFMEQSKAIKINANMESGWGELRSDYSYFPMW